MSQVLEVENIYKHYGKGENRVKAIDGVDFTIQKGEMVAIMGPSGSGKSTLLNVLSTIDEIDEGKILLSGQQLHNASTKEKVLFRREKLGFIFQELNLLDTLTLYENIKIALVINKYDRKK